MNSFGYQYFIGMGQSLKSGGNVHSGTESSQIFIGADQAHYCRTEIYANGYPEFFEIRVLANFFILGQLEEFFGSFDDHFGGGDRVFYYFFRRLVVERWPEEKNDAVANEFVETCAQRKGMFKHQVRPMVDQLGYAFRRFENLFADFGKAGNISKNDADLFVTWLQVKRIVVNF